MGKVRDILQEKGGITYSTTPDAIVYDALAFMVYKNVSALVVLENEQLVGIFSERDYARKVALKGKNSREIRIGEIMTRELITVTPDNTIDNCMRIMTTRFIRHLPVLENNQLAGIISIGDVVKHKIEEQQFIIENMEHYITGK